MCCRDGIFPASSCLKVSGHYGSGPEQGVSLTIRGCALDSGSLRADIEIARVSHCGTFYFQDRWGSGIITLYWL